MQFSVDVGDMTRSEQKILEFINTNRDTFLYYPSASWPRLWTCLTPPCPGLPRHVGCGTISR